MVELYSVCGEWKQNDKDQDWDFILDSTIGGSLCEVDENITYKVLAEMAIEYFRLDCLVSDIKLSYGLLLSMKKMVEASSPVYVRNDRQVQMFIRKIQEGPELIRLFVNVLKKCNLIAFENAGSNYQSITQHQVFQHLDGDMSSIASVREGKKDFQRPSGSSILCLPHVDTSLTTEKGIPDSVSIGCSHYTQATDDIHEGAYFKNKDELMMKMKKWALEKKSEFRSLWSDTTRLILGCVDAKCSWKMRATKLKSSDFFVVKKYFHEHSCDTTHRNANHRQATTKLLATFICSHYGENNAGLKPKQIVEKVRVDHGVHIKYKKAWRAKEEAQLLVRGSPEDSYHNLAKWLFMAKEKNPGSIIYLEMGPQDKFKYVFIAFGASIRGFGLMRRVIAVDGTFLKGKFKGTLLVATTQDGDHHLYSKAFSIVDSENDKSWGWFFRCLRVIIPDAQDLVFVSDRAQSITKALSELYPASHHGIYIFHLGNNIKVK